MKKYIVGNWKMNGSLADLAQIDAIDALAAANPGADVAVAPPFTLIAAATSRAKTLPIGAQDCHAAEKGAHTGCVSASMVKEAGAAFAIVGHSERRSDQHETSADVAAKAATLSAGGLGVILCIGESLDIREAGQAVSFVTDQLKDSLAGEIDPALLTIAYEPIWAIGTGRVAEVSDIAEMHKAIRTTLVETYGDAGNSVRIQYGGSVKGENAAEILATENVDGALVGGASLTAEAFGPIVEAAAKLG